MCVIEFDLLFVAFFLFYYFIIFALFVFALGAASAYPQQILTPLEVSALVTGVVHVRHTSKMLAGLLHRRNERRAVGGVDRGFDEIGIHLQRLYERIFSVLFIIIPEKDLKRYTVSAYPLVKLAFLVDRLSRFP